MKSRTTIYMRTMNLLTRKLFLVSTLVLLFSCSEPFSFENASSTIVVVDGEISTEFGSSYVRIYKVINDRYKEPINDLDVRVITDDGQIYQFRYNDDDEVYASIDFYFVGQEGARYRMEASSNEGIVYESTYDSIPIPLDFDVTLKDTTVIQFTEFDVLVERRAVAAIAILKPTENVIYTKLAFRYSYIDYFSADSIGKSDPNKYILHEALSDGKNIEIPVGLRIVEPFVFVNSDPKCNNMPLGTPCSLPCCRIEEFWRAKFEISSESMTKASYEFWIDAQKLTNNDGLIFDTNPFPLKTNVTCTNCENDVVGNFRTISKSISSTLWAE
jgi:hypothetical protein